MNSSTPSSPAPSTAGRWRAARRLLMATAAMATLVAVFYTVENWRGQRAWEKSRRELEAKGEVLDWAAYIPAPVPDAQNFYKAPRMQEWFVKGHFAIGGSQPPNAPFVPALGRGTNLVLAEVKVVPANAPLESQPTGTALRFADPLARDQAAKLLGEALGPCALGARQCVLVRRPLDQVKPVQLVLQADTVPSVKELTAFFPRNPLTSSALAYSDLSYLRVDATGTNAFRVSLKGPVYGAAEYLAGTEPQTANFDLVRQALERPYARIDCDYQQPFGIAVPNFIQIRNASQTLSERAQSYLLLGQPEAAWHELALVHDLCQILQAKPSGKPLTLVGVMVHVAVTGLYAGIVEDGLRLHAWGEPQLQALERQLQTTDLLTPLVEAFREERAATSRTFDITPRRELVKLLNFGPSRNTLDSALSTLALSCLPRGWFYQNMAVGARVEQDFLDSMEPTNQLVRPHQADNYYRGLEARLSRRSPYTFLVAISTPNFLRAMQTVVRNQTLVNQARLACALERYRLAQGHYPETLEALTPKFIEKPPHDLIGGQPLKYRRNAGGGYLLYSIGWDEKDDGGVPGKSREEGDWVWELAS